MGQIQINQQCAAGIKWRRDTDRDQMVKKEETSKRAGGGGDQTMAAKREDIMLLNVAPCLLDV